MIIIHVRLSLKKLGVYTMALFSSCFHQLKSYILGAP